MNELREVKPSNGDEVGDYLLALFILGINWLTGIIYPLYRFSSCLSAFKAKIAHRVLFNEIFLSQSLLCEWQFHDHFFSRVDWCTWRNYLHRVVLLVTNASSWSLSTLMYKCLNQPLRMTGIKKGGHQNVTPKLATGKQKQTFQRVLQSSDGNNQIRSSPVRKRVVAAGASLRADHEEIQELPQPSISQRPVGAVIVMKSRTHTHTHTHIHTHILSANVT